MAADASSIADELARYAKTSSRNRFQVANEIFDKVLSELADTTFTFSSKDNVVYVDGMLYYWSAMCAYDGYRQSDCLRQL